MALSRTDLEAKLTPYGQEHVLRFWDELDRDAQTHLARQIEAIDFAQLQRLTEGKDAVTDFDALAARAESPPAVQLDGSGTSWTVEAARQAGEEALAAGRLAAILVAGGQGTRLGFDQPKGLFPIGPVSQRTLFEMHADRIQAVADRYGVKIPLYIMTSPVTHEPTIRYLESANWLGFDRADVGVFCQGTMPAVDAKTGKLLLAERDAFALSPDGHGGMVSAIDKAGILEQAATRGIDQFFYAQIDNPLVQICDPTFVGHHLLAESELTSQVVRKRYPEEKVGVVVSVDDHVQVIEYSDLPEDAARRKADDGSLFFWAGSIAVHVFQRDFLQRAAASDSALPFHRAHKKVPHLDEAGNRVDPDEPNATKFEKFIFDLMPQAKNAIVVEADAAKVFAPVKNADGAPADTPSACRQALVALHRGWLEKAGGRVGDNVAVEINPKVALDAEETATRIGSVDVTEDRYFAPAATT